YDLVLADVHLPGMDGIELTRRIAARPERTPVILFTGYPTVDDAVRGMKQGARDYLCKPFSPDELRLVVARALEEKALRVENAALRHELAFGNLLGNAPSMRALFDTVRKVARADATILLAG